MLAVLESVVGRLPLWPVGGSTPRSSSDLLRPNFHTETRREASKRASPGPGLWLFVGGVAHGAELGHEEVVAPMVGRRVFLDVGELHELGKAKAATRRRVKTGRVSPAEFVCLSSSADVPSHTHAH